MVKGSSINFWFINKNSYCVFAMALKYLKLFIILDKKRNRVTFSFNLLNNNSIQTVNIFI